MLEKLRPLALVAMATLLLTAAAEARDYGGIKEKTASFQVLNSVMHDPVTLVFEPKDGKYEFKELHGAPVQLRLKVEKSRRAWISRYFIALGSWSGTKLVDTGWGDLKQEKIDKTFSMKMTRELLKPYESQGRNFCNEKGKPNEKVIDGRIVPLFVRVESNGKNLFMTENTMESWQGRDDMPLYIACLPEPFEVKDVQLSVKYDSTSHRCPVKATLNAKFKTNKPGKNKFTFVLVRDNGMKQEVNVETIGSGQESFAVWHKKYTFTKTEKRKYMIYVKGHKATAMWVPVGANCSSGPAGGFSNGPIPTN